MCRGNKLFGHKIKFYSEIRRELRFWWWTETPSKRGILGPVGDGIEERKVRYV